MRGFGSFLIIAFLLLCCPVQGSREGDVVLTIGDESFELGEFWHIYNKNRHLLAMRALQSLQKGLSITN